MSDELWLRLARGDEQLPTTEAGPDDVSMWPEERLAAASGRLLERTGLRANRGLVGYAEYAGAVNRLGARVFEVGDDEPTYILLHLPSGEMRVTYDLTMREPAVLVSYEVGDILPRQAEDVIRSPLAKLSDEQLQERYESEENAAMIAMARAQRTLAEIARRKDGA